MTMSDMTDEELAELEAAEKAALPAPWRWTNTWGMRYTAGPNKGEWCDPPDTQHDFVRMLSGEETEVFDDGSACGEYGGLVIEDPDARFIALMRNALPRLIAQARRVGRLEAALTEIAAFSDGDWGPHMDEPASAAKARAALKEDA
jgi:hypothetical protein